MTTRFATSADGAPVAYETRGTGTPALVFVHGWSCDRRYWRHQVEHFGASREVVAVDLAGHGESGGARVAWTMEAYGDDVAAVVRALGLDHVVLVGHSMGGDVAVAAARVLGGRVAGVVMADTYRELGGPPVDADEVLAPFHVDFAATVREQVSRMFRPASDRAVVDFVVADMAAAPPEVAIDTLRHAVTYEPTLVAALRELRAPVWAINSAYKPNDVANLAAHGVTTLLQDGVGHFLMLEDPDGFNRLLERALAAE